MQLQDHHWINKGCTVEILYGDNRSFNGVFKSFKVINMDLTKSRTSQQLNHFIVDVYGEHVSYCESELRLIEKPGYTRIKAGVWKADYLMTDEERNK